MSALRYNDRKPKWSLVDFKSLEPLVRVLEYGANKYSVYLNEDTGEVIKHSELPEDTSRFTLLESGRENWKLGLDKKEILESLLRHTFAILDGEDFDKESKLHHIGHIMANAMFYSHYLND